MGVLTECDLLLRASGGVSANIADNRRSRATTGARVAESVFHIVADGCTPIPVPAGQLGMPAAGILRTLSHEHVAVRPLAFASARPPRPRCRHHPIWCQATSLSARLARRCSLYRVNNIHEPLRRLCFDNPDTEASGSR